MLDLENNIHLALKDFSINRIRTTQLIRKLFPEVRGDMKERIGLIFPMLQKMEREGKIKLSKSFIKDTSYSEYIYIYKIDKKETEEIEAKAEEFSELVDKTGDPLWVRQIEDILKDVNLSSKKTSKKKKIASSDTLKDKVVRFNKIFDENNEEIVPSGEWQKVLQIFMENNLDDNTVWVACVKAFKAGVLWNKFGVDRQLEGDGDQNT